MPRYRSITLSINTSDDTEEIEMSADMNNVEWHDASNGSVMITLDLDDLLTNIREDTSLALSRDDYIDISIEGNDLNHHTSEPDVAFDSEAYEERLRELLEDYID